MRRELQIRNPRTGEDDYSIAPASADDVAAMCEKLRGAREKWLTGGLDKRSKILEIFSKALAKHRNSLTEALVRDTGRRRISVVEVDAVIGSISRWIAIAGEFTADSKGRSVALPFITYQIRGRPYPLVGVISPWNFPLTLAMVDAIPALLAGAAVIVKPSEVAPRFAGPLRDIIAGIPELDAVLTIVDGDGETGAALVDNVDAICFTGSVPTGRKVGVEAARNFTPAFLELGGKDPAIVLDGADIDRAATAILRASILATGQACQSIERIYVARPIFEEFLGALVEKAGAITLNTPDIHKGHLGPLIFAGQADIIADHIADAVAKGATVLTGGEIEDNGGLWCRPTILSGVTHDMKVMREESFGPLLPVMAFETVDEAVSLANDSRFGLSAAVFAGTDEEAIQVGERIEAGGISINDAALTSLMYEAEKNSFKLSGLGASRMGPSGYLRFFRRQSLMTNTADPFTIDQFGEGGAAE